MSWSVDKVHLKQKTADSKIKRNQAADTHVGFLYGIKLYACFCLIMYWTSKRQNVNHDVAI